MLVGRYLAAPGVGRPNTAPHKLRPIKSPETNHVNGVAMKRALKLAQPAIAGLLLMVSTPASAQFGGADEFQTMEQFAPVLEVMKQHMGKKRFGQLMQTVGPMMDQMMAGEGSSAAGGYGAFGGSHSFDVGRMVTLIDGQTIAGLVRAFEPTERPRAVRRHARRARP